MTQPEADLKFSEYMWAEVCWPQQCDLYRIRYAPETPDRDPASVLTCRQCGTCYQPTSANDVTIP